MTAGLLYASMDRAALASYELRSGLAHALNRKRTIKHLGKYATSALWLTLVSESLRRRTAAFDIQSVGLRGFALNESALSPTTLYDELRVRFTKTSDQLILDTEQITKSIQAILTARNITRSFRIQVWILLVTAGAVVASVLGAFAAIVGSQDSQKFFGGLFKVFWPH